MAVDSRRSKHGVPQAQPKWLNRHTLAQAKRARAAGWGYRDFVRNYGIYPKWHHLDELQDGYDEVAVWRAVYDPSPATFAILTVIEEIEADAQLLDRLEDPADSLTSIKSLAQKLQVDDGGLGRRLRANRARSEYRFRR